MFISMNPASLNAVVLWHSINVCSHIDGYSTLIPHRYNVQKINLIPGSITLCHKGRVRVAIIII